MRRVKLQMQITVNGFVAGPEGEMDWMTWSWDDELKEYTDAITKSVDTMLIGRKLAEGFIPYWGDILSQPEHEDYSFAEKMAESRLIVFSRTLKESKWPNAEVAGDSLGERVNALKSQDGRDFIAYGGADFVSSLVAADLIDDYYLFVNPVAVSEGMTIFGKLGRPYAMRLAESRQFECGIVVLHYARLEE